MMYQISLVNYEEENKFEKWKIIYFLFLRKKIIFNALIIDN